MKEPHGNVKEKACKVYEIWLSFRIVELGIAQAFICGSEYAREIG